MKEALRNLVNNEKFLNKLLSKVNEKLEGIKTNVRVNSQKIEQLKRQIENMQQIEKVNNICVYNLAQEANENITFKFIHLCKEKLEIDMKTEARTEDIVKCYRIGPMERANRPIIIKFSNSLIKKKLMKNAYKLKGSNSGFAEDMTKSRQNFTILLERNSTGKTFLHEMAPFL